MASTKKPHKKSKSKLTSRPKKFTGRYRELISPYIFSAFSILLILIGAALIFMASTSSLNLDWKHPFLPKKTELINQISQPLPKPQTLYIPKLSRTLQISEGTVLGNRWTISPTGVSYLATSAAPGSGNSVIYGHNLANILGDLYLVQNGDPIYVVLSTGNIVKYQVFEQKEVTPETVGILDPSEDSLLTVYTCSGFLDTARFVVVAKQTNFI